MDVGVLSPLVSPRPLPTPSNTQDQGSQRSSEGGDKQGRHKKHKKEKSRSHKNRIPEGMVTEFGSADFKTLKRNYFAYLPKIVGLGKALLEKEARQRHEEGNMATSVSWLESELSNDGSNFNTWDFNSAEYHKLKKERDEALGELSQLKVSLSSDEKANKEFVECAKRKKTL